MIQIQSKKETLEWQRFGDKRPEVGQMCLVKKVTTRGEWDHAEVTQLMIEGECPCWDDFDFLGQFTHDNDLWCPLPSGPQIVPAPIDAVDHILARIQCNPDLAYHISPGTETYEKLIAAHCVSHEKDPVLYEQNFRASLKIRAPLDSWTFEDTLTECLEYLQTRDNRLTDGICYRVLLALYEMRAHWRRFSLTPEMTKVLKDEEVLEE